MDENATTEACEECGGKEASDELVHLHLSGTPSRFLCPGCAIEALNRCVDAVVENPDLVPQFIEGADGEFHRFRFSTDVLPTGISVYAHEAGKEEGGYECEVLGGFDADLTALVRSLFERIRRELGRRHLEVEDDSLKICREGVVRGLIDHEDDREDLPFVVIDGRAVSWGAFGRMLMSYTGSQFKLEIYDLAEEIGDETLDHSRFLMSRTRDRTALN